MDTPASPKSSEGGRKKGGRSADSLADSHVLFFRLRVLLAFGVLPFALCLFSAALPARAADGAYPWEGKVWQLAAELLVNDALDALPPARAVHDPAERRRIDYTRGVLLLNVQPKLQGNITGARGLLESVRQSRGDDELGLNALYHLARIAQFHAEPGDPARAAALYQELIAAAPEHPLAQEAVARLAAIRLYEDVVPEERRARLEEFEKAAARLTSPPALRDTHFTLAEAYLLFTGDQAAALRHLLAAEAAGIVRHQLAANTTARIALLARDLGEREVALAHYRKFLATYQRDARAYMLGEQLKALEAQAPPTP